MDDKDSLVKALQGSHTVFAVTDYWAHLDMKKEIQQGKNMADAALAVGVQHYIWSTLENVTKREWNKKPVYRLWCVVFHDGN
jgi:hypothetical protein